MELKEAFVTTKSPVEIFTIIDAELLSNINTQVFIDKAIYTDLRYHGYLYKVYPQNYPKTSHYSHDRDNLGGEDWLSLKKENAFGELIARASFISNCNEYMQLVEFHSEGIKGYLHYLSGFEQLLLIKFESK